MKRAMAFLLALVMVIGMVPFGVFAAETEQVSIKLTTTASENLAVGDTFTVTATMNENPGIISFQLELLWNEDVLAFKGTAPNSAWVGATCADKYCTFVWSSAYESTVTGELFVATFEVIGYGDFGIRNNEEYYEICNDDYDVLNLALDASAVKNLSVAAPHVCEYVDNVLVAATCTGSGSVMRECACGNVIIESIPALGHEYVEGACTRCGEADPGYTTYTCACGDTYTADETGATGHTYKNGVCSVCGEANPDAVTYPWYGDGTSASYTISTAEELAQLAAIVNGTDVNYAQDDFSGKTVSLASDIALAADGLYIANENITYGSKSYPLTTTQYVLKEEAPVWTPIGTGTATSSYNNVTTISAFAGTFDGQGHTVSGVYTGTKNASAPNTASVQGLFGVVTGTVKNLTVSGCVTGRSVVGGIVAYLKGGTIENCVNKAIVFSDGGNKIGSETGGSGAGATGGIVGRAAGTGSVTGCVNNGHIVCANSNKGGRVAGIIGLIDATSDVVTIARNANFGTITGYQYVAGIVGLNYSNQSPITSCLNAGDIHAWGAQKIHVGGIVGQYNSPVSNCYSLTDIYLYWTALSQYVGGIAGDRTTYSGTAGNALTVTNCYVTGSVIYATNDSIGSMGMIVGDTSAKSGNNYYLDEGFAASSSHKGTVNTSYATSKTADELKAEAMVALLNGEEGTAWKMDGDCTAINAGYPILAWQTGAVYHNWVDASCTAAKTCSICGLTEGEALGHNYEIVVTDPTCTEAGFTTYTCTACGDSYVDEESMVEATGHSYEAVVTDPTCTEAGFTTYTCAVCGDSYVDTYVDALDHDYQDGVCTVCGAEDPDYQEPTEEPTEAPTQSGTGSNGTETGDSAQMMLWTVLMLLAMSGVAVLFVTRKKWMNV